MSHATNPGSARASAAKDAAFPSQPLENHTARFTADQSLTGAVITAEGELDASNAGELTEFIQRCAAHCKSVIVDLSGVEFFGTAGFSALHTINVRCAGAHVRWVVVPSHAVSRVLSICDPDNALPVAESVADANDLQPRQLFQLIP